MDFFNDLLETGGELIGGAVDTVGGFALEMLDYQKQLALSANPTTHRELSNDYQQPNGDVVRQSSAPSYGPYAAIGVGLLMVCGTVYFATKKR
ncbi:hypothetical protein VISI1226_13703 [Vibrio sinaloensis DSM 21326]|uniref:Uncharacterized protein n=1 Tax=Vibrio sinaloensis DSM 21326 TaxID=945550 RepID=E8M8N6_PHOS4|nr:hypothetical protein [Vibrio sinaloensis]EGA69581.1 hypothetical protein VISI1226_13703 [Vibrio sinaloensis DSM 21326]